MSRFSAARPVAAVALAVAAASPVLLALPNAAAAPLAAPTVSKTTVDAGENFTISGAGCTDPAPGAPLPGVSVSSTQLGDGEQVDPSGNWSLTTSFGMGTAPGTYSVHAVCQLSGGSVPYPAVSVTVAGEVTAPPPAPSPVPPAPRGPVSAPAPRTTTTAPPRTAVSTTSSAAAPTTALPTTAAPTTALPTGTAATTTASTLVAAPGCTDCAAIDNGDTLRSGQQLTLRYTGFQPGERVTLVMHSTPLTLGTFTADASGVVTARFTLPASAETGAHTLTFSGSVSGDREVPFRLAAASSGPSTAADHGQSSWPWLLVVAAAGLLVVAGVVFAVVRRARTASLRRELPAVPHDQEAPASVGR
jgi:hypothetical protein